MASMNTSLESLRKLYKDIKVAIKTFKTFSGMIESHMNDFITSEIWEKTYEEREMMLADDQRKIFSRYSCRCCYQYSSDDCHKYCFNRGEEEEDLNHKEKKMNTFLSPKKEHEIKRLSKVLTSMASDVQSTKIVDFGSGKGYVGQHITATYGYDVLGVEMNIGCASSADKRKEQLNSLHHHSYDKYKTINYAIDSNVVEQSNDFIRLVEQNIPNHTSQDRFILTGLHACGGLTSSALKIFCQEDSFKGLCIVGCCYNLISETEFPMSRTVKDLKINLDKSAKMLACQCPTKWDCTDQVLSKSLLHRAILQKILYDKGNPKDIKNIRFRKLGKKDVSFEKYMETVRTQCEQLNDCLSVEEQNVYYQTYNDIWQKMKEFHWLRMQLGPIIESIIILDRLAFLLEAGFEDTAIIRIFNQTISPRCYAIVCTRQ